MNYCLNQNSRGGSSYECSSRCDVIYHTHHWWAALISPELLVEFLLTVLFVIIHYRVYTRTVNTLRSREDGIRRNLIRCFWNYVSQALGFNEPAVRM